jgi:hypothetical protein
MLEMPNRIRFCPACRTPFEGENDFVAANRLFKNNIDLFIIKCNNHKHGCTTQNNLRAILDHEKDCDYNTGKLSKCSECEQWMEGSQKRYHNCLKAITKRVLWELVISSMINKLNFQIFLFLIYFLGRPFFENQRASI